MFFLPSMTKQCGFVFICLVFSGGPLLAAELSVAVKEKGTGDAVAAATVVLGDGGDYAVTDDKGKATLETAELPGQLKVLATGYETAVQKVDATIHDVTVFLYPVSGEGEGLEVIEDRVAEKVSKVILTAEELRRAPGSHGDPLRVVQSLPGVVSRGSQMYVRGSSAADNGVWANRLPLEYLYHWGDVFGNVSTINPDLVKDFNVFLAGFPVEYSDQLGGFFDVQLRPPKKDRLHQNYRIAVNEAALLVEGPVGHNDSFYVAGRHSYLDVLLSPDTVNGITGADKNPTKSSVVALPNYYDAQALWRHELQNGAVDAQYFAAGDAFSIVNRGSAKTNPELLGELSAKAGYQTLGVTWAQRWLPGWDSITAISLNNSRQEQTLGSDASGQAFYAKTNDLQGRFQPELRWQRSSDVTYAFGGEFRYGRFPVDVYTSPPAAGAAPGFNFTSAEKYQVSTTIRAGAISPYIKQRVAWTPRWTTDLGMRYSYIKGTAGIEMSAFTPRASVEYKLTPATELVASWGRYVQIPENSNLLSGFGNPYLDFTDAEHRVLGIHHKFNALWNIQLEAYHKPMSHLSVSVAGQAPPNNYANAGSGEAYGVDLLIKREYAGGKMGWLSYSYSHAERTTNGETYTFGGDQPHTLTAVWSQPLPGFLRRWALGVRFQAHSGRAYTPIIGREKWCQSSNTACPGQNEADPDVYWRPIFEEVRNNHRLPTFYLMDLRVDRPVRFNTWKMNFYVDMQNVTFAENVIGYNYGENYQNYANPQKATGLSILIPFFGVEASF